MSDVAYSNDDDDTEGLEPDVHTRAVMRFDDITCAVQEERALALSDRRFVSISGAQWEGAWAAQFENSIMVEVNKTAQGVEKICADYRANRVTVNFRGVDKGADEQTAITLDGMFRADAYASKASQAFDNAFEEAVQGGIGAWRLTTKYDDEYDSENDQQRVCFEAIVDADQSVFWDMNARLYDKSDAKFAYVITAMTRQAFLDEYGDVDHANWPDDILKTYYDWYTPDVVRVCEYYEVEDVTRKLLIFQHRATGEDRREWASDLDSDELANMKAEGWVQQRTRMTGRRQVKKWVLSGQAILVEGQVIAGDQIPIVPVYGKRWFIDNMERSRGHVRLAKDPQRIYNAQISKLTETAALAPIERPIFTPEQVAGHEQSWADANLNRSPYALVNPMIAPDGNPIPAGPIAMISPPQLSPVLAALIQQTASDIAELTSADDGADQVVSNISAEAMDIAATRTDAKSGIYMDNMKQSMQRCGEIYLSMRRDITLEGQEVETLSEDGTSDTAVIGEPHSDDQGNYSIRNDIAKGKYKVISDVTEATATRRDKTVKTLMNGAQMIAAFDPEMANAFVLTAMTNMDGEGIQDLQDWLRAKGVASGMIKPTKDEQAQLEQAQQNQPPDPTAVAVQAQAEALRADAAKSAALTQKAVADTKLSEANTVKTLAEAHKIGTEADQSHVLGEQTDQTHKLGMVERIKGLFTPGKPAK